MVIAFVTMVIAQGVGEGDVITQEQLDSINASTFNLQCQFEDIGQGHTIFYTGDWYYYRIVSCLSLEPVDIDNLAEGYLIIRPEHLPNFLISDYFACRENNNAQYCNDFYTNVLIEYHQSNVEAIRNKIRNWQTVEGNDENNDYEDDFEL